MRIGELSRRSGVSVATIKYYIREGLVPPGEPRGRNQADYGEEHLARLALVRSLREVGDLGIATIKQTLDAIEGEDPVRAPLAVALRALPGPVPEPEASAAGGDEVGLAQASVDAMLDRLGWEVAEDLPARQALVGAVVALQRHWPGGVSEGALDAYARVAEELARLEIPEDWNPGGDPGAAVSYAVLGTVLFEPVILALRRMAHAERGRRLASERGQQG